MPDVLSTPGMGDLLRTTPRFGIVEGVLDQAATGWAIDRTQAGPVSLFLFIDDRPVANFRCGLDRPDLSGAGLPGTAAGFRVAVPEQYQDGAPHSVAIRFQTGEHLFFVDAAGRAAASATVTLEPPKRLESSCDGLVDGALRGWAAVREPGAAQPRGGQGIAVWCDGMEIGRVRGDRFRPDVAKAVGCEPRCGFVFMPPARFRNGRSHTFHFRIAATGEELGGSPISFAYPISLPSTRLAALYATLEDISSQLWQLKRDLRGMMSSTVHTLDEYDAWVRQYHAALRTRRRAPWPSGRPTPLVSVICPVYRPRLADFKAAAGSVLAQTYRHWELILVDDGSDCPALTAAIAELCAADARIRAVPRTGNGGISEATNAALREARGEYTAFFDHDDLLLDVALEVMVEAALETGARLLYSDEDKIDDYGRFSEPHFKSDWNYRLLLAQNYVCHFMVVDTALLREVGPLDSARDGAQDHDLVLRLSELLDESEIAHVPEVVYHWRKTPGSTAESVTNKTYAVTAGADAVRAHLARRGRAAEVSPLLDMTMYRVDWRFEAEPAVAIVVPFKEQVAMTRRCLDALLHATAYGRFQVVLVDNWSASAEAAAFCAEAAADPRVSVLHVEEPFNFSRLNNLACTRLEAEFLVFMNNDVVVGQPDWLRRLVDEALADDRVAAVGAKLLYPDGTVQHGGVVLGVGGIADHVNRGAAADDPFYMGRGVCAQEMSAVTAALMLCRAAAFRRVGGFDEADLAVAFNDVDLCLKLRQAGFKVVYTPDVVAEHHESVSRGDDLSRGQLGRFVLESQTMRVRWGAEIDGDPFYNPNFSAEGGIFLELSSVPLRTGIGE